MASMNRSNNDGNTVIITQPQAQQASYGQPYAQNPGYYGQPAYGQPYNQPAYGQPGYNQQPQPIIITNGWSGEVLFLELGVI